MALEMRTAVIAVTLGVALGGCVHTPNGWRKSEPLLEVTSQKSVDDVVRCVADIWQSQGQQPTYLPSAKGATLWIKSPEAILPNSLVYSLLDIERGELGSKVRYYSVFGKSTKTEIEGCL